MIELALIFGLSMLGIGFAAFLARWVFARPIGDVPLAESAARIGLVADAFFRRKSGAVSALSAVLGGAIFLGYGLLRGGPTGAPFSMLERGVWLTLSFALGAGLSLVAGRVATFVATRAAVRVATGARRSVDQALQLAMRAGASSGLFATCASVLSAALLFAAIFFVHAQLGRAPGLGYAIAADAPLLLAGLPLGAAFAALLSQLSGGVFAKAADLAADVGGREASLAEDEPRNPATIADLAGDVVGDCAGRAALGFAATSAETLAVMLLAARLFRDNPGLPSVLAVVLFPLVARAFGVVGAAFGVMVVRTDDREEPESAIARGLYVAAALHLTGVAGAAKWLLGDAWTWFFASAALGVTAVVLLFHAAVYYTSARHRPVRELADVSRGGATMTVLRGLALGLESSVAPFVVVVVTLLASFALGARSGLSGGALFGAAAAVVGMLGVSPFVLSVGSFAPIVDNASGIVEMTVGRERPEVRGRTALLDAVGNSAKAFANVTAGVSSVLGALLLVAAFVGEARRLGRGAEAALVRVESLAVRADRPEVLVGALLGLALVLWLSAHAMTGTLRAARRVLDEVRRQLRDLPPGVPPKPEPCVEIAAAAGLRAMVAPAVLVLGVPVTLGVALRLLRGPDNPWSAVDSVAALLVAATAAGALGSLLLGSSGGAWDNAKRYIATGAHGGTHLVDDGGERLANPGYVAAAVGDSVGDPLKDVAAPVLHALVKLLPASALVFLPFYL